MPEKKDRSPRPEPGPFGAGARVLVRRPSESAQTGRIIEDYAELTNTEERGHAWAPVHRWAIALDDGRLVFADTDDLTADLSTPGSSG
ncbi:hypothetical protein I1A62_08720 [Rhodococcus sp. USK10]|uniref:hypothetical protein n=1 Tax=Rhodococcus sp. USK10 TaxID=2789739 RepID=UPI001C5EF17D|nr:hypothetical protein [Rhodococcus sp. USK10]QYB04549.1 hypothetical protein I1A62_08720 [Rhodococcus sp. USK10]